MTGVGCLAGAPVVLASSALAAAGITLLGKGANDLINSEKTALSKSSGNGGSTDSGNPASDIPNIVHDGVNDIIDNGRPQRLDDNGKPDFFRVRPDTPGKIARKWGGAKIYDIPGGGNSYRVLINKWGDIGWVVNHNYDKIMPYLSK